MCYNSNIAAAKTGTLSGLSFMLGAFSGSAVANRKEQSHETEKEGACWYLRIFIDQESGITIEDCEKMTEPVNKLLDEQDPISQNYILEVGSAGLEREFNRTWHFTDGIGTEVRARTIRPIDGEREFIGTLQSCKDDMLTLETETGSISLPLAALTFVKRYEAFEF